MLCCLNEVLSTNSPREHLKVLITRKASQESPQRDQPESVYVWTGAFQTRASGRSVSESLCVTGVSHCVEVFSLGEQC